MRGARVATAFGRVGSGRLSGGGYRGCDGGLKAAGDAEAGETPTKTAAGAAVGTGTAHTFGLD